MLALLLFVAAQTSSVLHGMVRHVRCAEHGELVETVGARAQVQVTHDVDTLAAFELVADDEHAHCPLTLNPGAGGSLGFPSALLTLVPIELAPAATEAVDSGVVVAPATPVFVIAPKQGPPAQPSPLPRSV